MMNEEGVFPRLRELIQERKGDDSSLHRMLLELLYEMSRIQRLRMEDLGELRMPMLVVGNDLMGGLSLD